MLPALDVVQPLLRQPAARRAQLERPQEVGHLLERRAGGHELVHDVLDADDAVRAERLLDDGVVRERDAAPLDLARAALVDQLLDGLDVGVAPRDVGLDEPQHVDGGLVDLDEHGVVDLAQAQQLEDLARLRVQVVDAADADDERDLGLGLDVEAAGLLGLAAEADEVGLLFFCVFLCFFLRLGGGVGGGG